MKIYYVYADTNENGKVTCGQFQDDMSRLVYPYQWDKRSRCWVNVSGCYTPAEVRRRMRSDAVNFDWK